MSSTSPRPRRRPLPAVAILSAVCALAIPSTGLAATTPKPSHPTITHHRTRTKHRPRRRPKPAKPLTNAQIIALIKKYERPGPQGPGGPPGPTGANGAAAGYSAAGAGGPISGTTTVVSKTLPAGIFIVHAKVVLNANSSAAGSALAECDLMSGATVLDLAQWDQPLSTLIINAVYAAATTLPVEAGVDLTSPSTVSLQCFLTGPSVALTAGNAQLQAVQVNTAN